MQKIVFNFLLVLITGISFAQEEPYRGGSADGHAFERSETTFSFSPSFQPFRGGDGDGYSFVSQETPFGSAISFQPFRGGNGDGYSFVSQETPFGPAISFQPFRGDTGDGYKSDSLILFDPRAYITMYYPFAGSLGDGATNSPVLGIFIPLPLKLLEFKGEQDRDKNILLWTTANEEQTASFIIQRSADALHYKDIGTIAAAGDYSGTLQYRFEDIQPLDKNNYYRLKMLDQDGSFTYSSIILLKRYGSGSKLTVFPNPTTQSVNIKMSRASSTGIVTVQLMDLKGTVLQQKQIINTSIINFDLDRYMPGIYLIRVKVDGEQSVWRVIKQ